MLAEVCAHWKCLTYSNPLLWERPLPPLRRKQKSTDIIATQTWLQRSAPLPIPVSLDTSAHRSWSMEELDVSSKAPHCARGNSRGLAEGPRIGGFV
ncbi:hypothetical protein B0H10DRAFT_826901 [Mycena sp. CBHHK59/15]|nr:hypothetical protein B0H10DRAFT_826901 [Mycena sp. CBHHK59/15]